MEEALYAIYMHTHINLYAYIYLCVYICVCRCVSQASGAQFSMEFWGRGATFIPDFGFFNFAEIFLLGFLATDKMVDLGANLVYPIN